VSDRSIRDELFRAAAEALFVVLPLVVTALVEVFWNHTWRVILFSPEWCFGATVFAGQTLMRVVMGVAEAGPRGITTNPARTTFVSALITVALLLPSMAVLIMLLASPQASVGLAVVQIVLFVVSLGVFIVVGSRMGVGATAGGPIAPPPRP
jgi:hypothetical protein